MIFKFTGRYVRQTVEPLVFECLEWQGALFDFDDDEALDQLLGLLRHEVPHPALELELPQPDLLDQILNAFKSTTENRKAGFHSAWCIEHIRRPTCRLLH